MIQLAKSLGMKTMLGGMISSSVAVTAAAQLSPLADYADLDGNLPISNDPYSGVTVKEGKLILPDRPGLGLKPARLQQSPGAGGFLDREARHGPPQDRCGAGESGCIQGYQRLICEMVCASWPLLAWRSTLRPRLR
jgi:hypothetical protein